MVQKPSLPFHACNVKCSDSNGPASLNLQCSVYKSRDSSVGIATRLRTGRSGFVGLVPGGAGNSSFRHYVQTGPEAHPVSYPIGTGGALSLGLKRPGLEADHSPPSSAKVKECVELYLHSPNTSSWRGVS
jgi:hypothetical protein